MVLLSNEINPIGPKQANLTFSSGAEIPGLPTMGCSWIIWAKTKHAHGSMQISQNSSRVVLSEILISIIMSIKFSVTKIGSYFWVIFESFLNYF